MALRVGSAWWVRGGEKDRWRTSSGTRRGIKMERERGKDQGDEQGDEKRNEQGGEPRYEARGRY